VEAVAVRRRLERRGLTQLGSRALQAAASVSATAASCCIPNSSERARTDVWEVEVWCGTRTSSSSSRCKHWRRVARYRWPMQQLVDGLGIRQLLEILLQVLDLLREPARPLVVDAVLREIHWQRRVGGLAEASLLELLRYAARELLELGVVAALERLERAMVEAAGDSVVRDSDAQRHAPIALGSHRRLIERATVRQRRLMRYTRVQRREEVPLARRVHLRLDDLMQIHLGIKALVLGIDLEEGGRVLLGVRLHWRNRFGDARLCHELQHVLCRRFTRLMHCLHRHSRDQYSTITWYSSRLWQAYEIDLHAHKALWDSVLAQ